eukprot:SAG22_NODE_2199_length_2847_cov_1.666667_1_plen_169_part_00
MLNTGVTAALVGGFALGNIQGGPLEEDLFLDVAVYLANVVAVHACTCSSLMSAFLYRKVNGLPDHEVTAWARSNPIMLAVPLAKFTAGCVCYLTSVVFQSYRDLAVSDTARWASLGIGVSSVSMVFATILYIACTSKDNDFFSDSKPEEDEGQAAEQDRAASRRGRGR